MTNNYIKGIDVSIIQGTVPWDAVAASGVQFAIMRAGVGNNGIDANYAKNIAGAKAAGLYTAAYNFAFPLPTTVAQPLRDPVKQAQYHFNTTGGSLTILDWEWPTSDLWSKYGCSKQQINDWGLTYLAEYTRLDGKKPLIYTYPNFVQTLNTPSDYAQYDLWIASYAPTPLIPKPWNSWKLWQNSGGTQKLPNGVPVDTDLAVDLSLWGISSISAVPSSSIPEVSTTSPSPAPPPPAIVAPTPLPAPPIAPSAPAPTFNISAVSGIIQNIYNWFKKN